MEFDGGYWLTRFTFQRGLAFVYLLGFLVAANQFRPLLGERGLMPVPRFLERARFWRTPSLFHLVYSDRLANALAWCGVVLSLFALSGLSESFGTPVSVLVWALLWALYLSFVNVGQTFYAYGWESILLETGFLAIFLGASNVAPPEIVIWLLRWVLFRVMFGAGLIKLRGDECWRDLTCLVYHYETQPLPNRLSWYFHRLPVPVHKAGVLSTHFVQLVVPFGYFAPAPISWIAGGLTIGFQATLILSGNLSWLNHMTIILALACFDDALLGAALPLEPAAVAHRALPHDVAVIALAILVVVLSIRPVVNMLSSRQMMNARFDPFHLVNTYGAFGNVTRRRNEVVIEGTADAAPGESTRWEEYEFKGKPGDPLQPPSFVSPYHLRLDWQMWFAAMSSYRYAPWTLDLMAKLLEGDAATLRLFKRVPFQEAPPRYVRARLYRYRFSDVRERRATGRWWTRAPVGEYLPALSNDHPAILQVRARREPTS